MGPTVGDYLDARNARALYLKYFNKRVRHVDDNMTGRVIGSEGEQLCVRWDDGDTDTHTLNFLRAA